MRTLPNLYVKESLATVEEVADLSESANIFNTAVIITIWPRVPPVMAWATSRNVGEWAAMNKTSARFYDIEHAVEVAMGIALQFIPRSLPPAIAVVRPSVVVNIPWRFNYPITNILFTGGAANLEAESNNFHPWRKMWQQ